MEVASSRPDYLPTLSAAKVSKLSLLVKHHILAIDEASYVLMASVAPILWIYIYIYIQVSKKQ